MDELTTHTDGRKATILVRLALWFVAVLSFGEALPGFSESWRSGKSETFSIACSSPSEGCFAEETVLTSADAIGAAVAAIVDASGLDGDDATRSFVLAESGGTLPVSAALAPVWLDGSSQSAFNSRAPPRTA